MDPVAGTLLMGKLVFNLISHFPLSDSLPSKSPFLFVQLKKYLPHFKTFENR